MRVCRNGELRVVFRSVRRGCRLEGWQATAARAAVCLSALFASPSLLAAEPLDVRVEASVTHDSNITRSRGAENVLSDVIYNLNAGKSYLVPLSENARLSLLGTAGVEAFHRYRRLSRLFLGVEAELQYRPSAEFAAPTFGLFGRAAVDFYDSRLRDGHRHSVGGRVLQPLTDRLDLFAALAHNVRNAEGSPFDNKENSGRLNLDYSLSEKGTLYLGGEYRHGQIASTNLSNPAPGAVEVQERDDAFSNPDRTAYRLKARTGIVTIGYSHGLASDRSLDFSIRRVRSTVLPLGGVPLAETIRYYDTQATVAFLIRF